MTGLASVPPGASFSVSATLFMIYRKCPQQALARVQGVFAPPSRASFRGILAHRVFARHIADGPISDDEFEMTCRKEAGEHLGEMMAGLSMRPSEFRGLVAELRDLYGRFRGIPLEGVVGAEVPIEVEPVEGVEVKGRVDAVFDDDGATRIVDWKTGADLSDAESQLRFYALAWNLANGTAPERLEAMSVRTGEKVMVLPDGPLLEEVEADVAAMVSAIRGAIERGGDLQRTAGPHCRWCPLLDECDEGSAAMSLLA